MRPVNSPGPGDYITVEDGEPIVDTVGSRGTNIVATVRQVTPAGIGRDTLVTEAGSKQSPIELHSNTCPVHQFDDLLTACVWLNDNQRKLKKAFYKHNETHQPPKFWFVNTELVDWEEVVSPLDSSKKILMHPPESVKSSLMVRWQVASDNTTSAEELAKLVGDVNVDVRWRVAKHPNTPIEAFSKLAIDTCAKVRQHVAENTRAPVEILNILSKDSDIEVSRSAVQTLESIQGSRK